jgi:hypothetical protein
MGRKAVLRGRLDFFAHAPLSMADFDKDAILIPGQVVRLRIYELFPNATATPKDGILQIL